MDLFKIRVRMEKEYHMSKIAAPTLNLTLKVPINKNKCEKFVRIHTCTIMLHVSYRISCDTLFVDNTFKYTFILHLFLLLYNLTAGVYFFFYNNHNNQKHAHPQSVFTLYTIQRCFLCLSFFPLTPDKYIFSRFLYSWGQGSLR